MKSFLDGVTDFFAKIFSFGRRLFSDPFFENVFAVAGLLYPPAMPVIDSVDRLFDQDSEEGFLEQLDQLLTQSGMERREAEIVKRLVAMFFQPNPSSSDHNTQKAALTRELLKTGIAANRGEFRTYGVSQAVEQLYRLKIRGVEDKEQIPDHLVNFSMELSIVQRKFNRMLDTLCAYAQTAMQPLLDATPEKTQKLLEAGRARGLWSYTAEDYQRAEVQKAVAALLTKEEAIEEGFVLWSRPVTSIQHIPDCLANFAVEACTANTQTIALAVQ